MLTRRDMLEQWCSGVDWGVTHGVVCVGLSDLHPWEVFRRYRSDVTVFIFDPSDRVIVDTRLAISSTGTQNVVAVSHLADLRVAVAQRTRVNSRLEIMGEPSLHAEWGILVTRTVGEARQFRYSMELTTRLNAKKWTSLALDAIHHIAGSAPLNAMPECFDGVPAVIVGAGPSLARNIEHLKSIQDNVAIIAVNSSIGPLEDAGIQPDVICVVESFHRSITPILDSPLWKRAALVYGSHAWPGIFEVDARHKIPAIQAVGPVGSWLCRHMNILPILTGGSVTTLAYRVAEVLGADPIVLVGMDCAEGPEGRDMHAPGVRYDGDRDAAAFDHVRHPVLAWGGMGQVMTTPALDGYRQWFEAQAATIRPGLRIVNATEGGARIDRWAEIPLERLRFDRKLDVMSMLDSAIDDTPAIRPEWIADGLREQAAAIPVLSEASAELRGAASIVLDRIHEMPEIGNAASILNGYAIPPIEDAGMLPEGDQLRALHRAFEAVVDGAQVVLPQINRAIAALEARYATA